ncbi:MAG: hypothetical protein K1Y36_28885 [Blastocatellia bacterium]|nr:hypothetical protein [Blastocatellia bacterium]
MAEKLIIVIHGLSNKPAAAAHQADLHASIAEGLRLNCGLPNQAIPLELVYWANYLYKHPLHRDPAFSFDSLYDTEPYLEAASGALKKYQDGWTDRLRADVGSAVGSLLDRVKGSLGLDAAADFVIARKLKDLDFYYDAQRQLADRTQALRQARLVLQDELQNTLVAHKDKHLMLIAHSMGSIIAYDVLRNLGHPDQGVRIPYFVTIGSPLGLPPVKHHVVTERTYAPQLRTPSIVTQSWKNFADRRDPVAFDSHLRDDYGPNASGIQVADDLILNDYSSNGKPNPHKIFGYLRAPEVSEHIAAFLA